MTPVPDCFTVSYGDIMQNSVAVTVTAAAAAAAAAADDDDDDDV